MGSRDAWSVSLESPMPAELSLQASTALGAIALATEARKFYTTQLPHSLASRVLPTAKVREERERDRDLIHSLPPPTSVSISQKTVAAQSPLVISGAWKPGGDNPQWEIPPESRRGRC